MRIHGVALLLLCGSAAWPQNEQEIAEGKAMFRSNCAFCHGLTARGGRGPALLKPTRDVAAAIRDGVPGTSMPAFEFPPEELRALAAYVRSLAGPAPAPAPVAGDAAHGRQVYEGSGCAGCHRIGERGSVLGPDLTRIGAARSPEYIRESIVDPSADIPPEYEAVTVTTREGARVTGMRMNEDTFTVQLRDASQAFRMFRKDEVKSVAREPKSLMPPYKALPQRDLQDLLAYLGTLRGRADAGAAVRRAEGIR